MVLGTAGMFASVVALLGSVSRVDEADALADPIRAQVPQGMDICTPEAPAHPDCARVNELSDEGDMLRNVAIGTGIAGGALFTAGLVYLLLPEGDPKRPEVVVSVSGQSATVQLSGRF
jgi:hypothetical protein